MSTIWFKIRQSQSTDLKAVYLNASIEWTVRFLDQVTAFFLSFLIVWPKQWQQCRISLAFLLFILPVHIYSLCSRRGTLRHSTYTFITNLSRRELRKRSRGYRECTQKRPARPFATENRTRGRWWHWDHFSLNNFIHLFDAKWNPFIGLK